MIQILTNLLTRNKTEIPLFYVNFDYQYYKKLGEKNSCMAHIHPVIQDDEYIQQTLKELITYIRDNYNMDELV